MIEHNLARPAILVDLKKYRIRIHKNTLHSIGNPKHILLLVNPEERTLEFNAVTVLFHGFIIFHWLLSQKENPLSIQQISGGKSAQCM
jgi:hypothetical protein